MDAEARDAHDDGAHDGAQTPHTRGAVAQSADTTDDVVALDLPLHHRHASTVRVVAASLAADLGFSVDEIEDLRLGVDEAVSVMADTDGEPGARLHLRFVLAGQTITVSVTRSGVAAVITRADVDELATRILHAVVDEFDVSDDGAFVVSKRAATSHAD